MTKSFQVGFSAASGASFTDRAGHVFLSGADLANGVPSRSFPPPRGLQKLRDGHGPILISGNHGGLVDRLTCLLSTLALATASGRPMYAHWEPNDHCAANLGDLFDLGVHGGRTFELSDFEGPFGVFFNYDDITRTVIDDEPVNLVVHSYVPVGTAAHPVSDAAVRAAYGSLVPNKAVRDKLASFDEVSFENVLGFHARQPFPNRAFGELEISKFPWDAAFFVERLSEALARRPNVEKVFLCTNNLETAQILEDRYGDIIFRHRPTSIDNTRDAVALQDALVDLTLLSRCPELLTPAKSGWGRFVRMTGGGEVTAIELADAGR